MEPNMNKLVIIAGFALYLVVFVGTSQTGETMLELLVSTENHTDYKCPYLRETMLNGAQFDFFKDCPGSTKIRANSDMLCVLFYNNFLRLCNYSTRYNFDLRILLNDSTVKASLGQSNIDGVCENLKSTEPFNQSLGQTLARINGYLTHNCPLLCLSYIDNTTFPICTMSAMMSGFAGQLSKVAAQTATVRKQEVKGKPEVKLDDKKARPEAATPPKTNETKPIESGKPAAKKDAVVKVLQAPLRQVEKVAESSQDEPKPKPDGEKPAPPKPEKTVQDPPKEIVPKTEPQKPEAKGKKVEDVPKVAPEAPKVNTDGKQEEKVKVEDNEKVEVVNENRDSQYDLDDDMAILKTEEDEPSAKSGKPKPKETSEDVVPANPNNQMDEEDSFFFVYFMMVCAVFILGYIGYHNKQKVLALVIEGRRGRRASRRGGRPNSANYHKLDSNLEEAVTSSVHKNTTNIIY